MQVVSSDPDLNGRSLLTSTLGIGYVYANEVGCLPAYAYWTSGNYIAGFLGNWFNIDVLGYLTTAAIGESGFTVDTNSCLLSFDGQSDWTLCKGTPSWPILAPGQRDLACLDPVSIKLALV